jgi:hypothetical protein
MKIGSRVRLIGVPEGLEDSPDLHTKTTFERCLGHEFPVAGFNELGMVELIVESVTGSVGEVIWVKSEFLAIID